MRISDWSSDVCSSDLQPAKAPRRVPKGKAEAGDDDDDHRNDLGDRPLDALEDRLQRSFPRHRRTAGMRRGGSGHHQESSCRSDRNAIGAAPEGMAQREFPWDWARADGRDDGKESDMQ